MSFKKFVLIFVILPGLLILLFYTVGLLYIKSQWKYDFSNDEMNLFAHKIKSSKALPLNFQKMLDTVESNYEISMNWRFFYLLLPRFISRHGLHKYLKNDYENVAKLLIRKRQKDINSLFSGQLVLAFGLEKYVTLEECANYYYNNLEVNLKLDTFQRYNIIGINQFSNTFYLKNSSELNDRETIVAISAFQLAADFDTITSNFLQNRVIMNERILEKKKEH